MATIVVLVGIAACNYTVGDCWPVGQGDSNVAVGSGVINSTGPGNPGDSPQGQARSALTQAQCNAPEDNGTVDQLGVGVFDASVFKFVTTIADDGQGEGGGWQEATSTLTFVSLDSLTRWTCQITVGMPVRAQAFGVISPVDAATLSAALATRSWKKLREKSPDLPPGIFCSRFKTGMEALFAAKPYDALGARVNLNSP